VSPPIGAHSFGYPKSMRLRRRREYLAAQGARYRYRSPVGLVAIYPRFGLEKNEPGYQGTGVDPSGSESACQRLMLMETGEHIYSGPRLGITVTKKVGPAPLRNRWKRRIRESFRLGPAHWVEASGLDFVWIVRPDAPLVSIEEAQSVFREGLNRWLRRYRGL
jgi:ribonuclease P protein component